MSFCLFLLALVAVAKGAKVPHQGDQAEHRLEAQEERNNVQKVTDDCNTRLADLEARNAQMEKQYQELLTEMEQKEQDHTMEVNQLKDNMNKLRAEMEAMLVELQTLKDAKLSLELEIAAYRKMLETEESSHHRRASTAALQHCEKRATYSALSMKMMREQVSATITYYRTINGPVAIAATSPEGKFIQLENNPNSGVRKEVNLTKWSLRRVLDNKASIIYIFPTSAVIKIGKTLKIWAAAFSSERSDGDLVFNEEDSWGTGAQITTTLFNENNEEKASLIQTTVYS